MSELRRDPLSHAWVAIAPERGGRRDELDEEQASRRPPEARAWEPDCPFCPGNEARTPPPSLVYPEAGGWRVRVLPNKYPVVRDPPIDAPGEDAEGMESGVFHARTGIGAHEVIVDSPHHTRPIALMEDEQVELLLRAYRERHRALRREQWAGFVALFKNHGADAGASLRHPHSQLVVLPVVPPQARAQVALAAAYHDATGRSLHADVVAAELEAGERVVAADGRFVVYCPYASRAKYELRLAPRAPRPSFADTTDAELRALAPLLRGALARLHRALDDPSFNLLVHSAPEDEQPPWYGWYVAILPRLMTAAGFELGSGIHVNTVPPEEAAARLREA